MLLKVMPQHKEASNGVKDQQQQYESTARRQAVRINNSGQSLSRGDAVLRLADILEAEARFLDEVVELGHPARGAIANLAFASEALRAL